VRARLTALAGPLAGQEIRLLTGRTKIGKAPREEEGAVVIAVADGYLSKEHVALEAGAGGVVLRDLGSTNGTFANGRRVERAILRDGDELRIGQSVFRVVLPGQAG
jgi:pSer/pThr/pTyr-binding forkhead associated (FHA) protein